MKLLMLFILILCLVPLAEAKSCRELANDKDFVTYFEKLKQTNPLMRPRLSLLFEMSPCEKDECGVAGRHQRLEKREVIHLVRQEEKKRIRFIKGTNAPQCILRLGERDLKCLRCDEQTNQLCRVYQSDTSPTRLQGTNIDEKDFDFMESGQFSHKCEEVKQGKYLKLTSQLKAGLKNYIKVESFIEAKRDVPILIRYFTLEGLSKVYRFFPQYYIQTKQGWVSAWFQVRSVTGHENRFHFETTFKLIKGSDQQWQLFSDLNQDPMIGGGDELFLAP